LATVKTLLILKEVVEEVVEVKEELSEQDVLQLE